MMRITTAKSMVWLKKNLCLIESCLVRTIRISWPWIHMLQVPQVGHWRALLYKSTAQPSLCEESSIEAHTVMLCVDCCVTAAGHHLHDGLRGLRRQQRKDISGHLCSDALHLHDWQCSTLRLRFPSAALLGSGRDGPRELVLWLQTGTCHRSVLLAVRRIKP